MKKKLISDWIRQDVEGGQYLKALLEASADLETLFFMKLMYEKGIKGELLKGWTLSRYIDWVSKMSMLDERSERLLREFNEVRNYIVHQRYVMNQLNHPGNTTILAKLILSVCDFIDSYEVEYVHDQTIEDEYSKFLQTINQKHKKLFPY